MRATFTSRGLVPDVESLPMPPQSKAITEVCQLLANNTPVLTIGIRHP